MATEKSWADIHDSRDSKHQGCEYSASCAGISKRTWGQYSPYFPAPSEIEPSTPKDCRVTFVQVLSRHGSRGPTASKLDAYSELVSSLQKNVRSYGEGFEFIKDYKFDLFADNLTAYGEEEMRDSGALFYKRYRHLAHKATPFLRAAGSPRVVESAQHFGNAFYTAQGLEKKPDVLVIPEEPGYNNTLDRSGCPAFDTGPGGEVGAKLKKEWSEKWVPKITERLNSKLVGANLTDRDTVYLMDLCPFNTIADMDAELSDFCKLFNQDEWHSYDYYQSLGKWYDYGPGRDLGPSTGVGFVNELLARLTGKPVNDHTTTNSTLDNSPKTFPLDRKLYADFSHDNTMISIYAAMGLFNGTKDLPADHKVPPARLGGYSTSWTVPFAARMYVEKMRCKDAPDEELVRVLVDDRVMKLFGCGVDELGRCKLSRFVESQTFAREGGHWGECFKMF